MFFWFSLKTIKLSCWELKARWMLLFVRSKHKLELSWGSYKEILRTGSEPQHQASGTTNRLWPQHCWLILTRRKLSYFSGSSARCQVFYATLTTQYHKPCWREDLTVRKAEITCYYTAWMQSCLTGTIGSLRRQQVATQAPQQPLDSPIDLHVTNTLKGS